MKSHAQRMLLGRPRFTYANQWDSQMIHGCECDSGWTGFDCTQRKFHPMLFTGNPYIPRAFAELCEVGDDPMTVGQLDAVQLLRCDYPASPDALFTLSFNGETTKPLSGDMLATDLQRELEALSTVGKVSVAFDSHDNAVTALCNEFGTPRSNSIVKITFLSDFGDLPTLSLLNPDGSAFDAVKAARIEVAADGATLQRSGDGASLTSIKSTKESRLCSGRGTCDTSSGSCRCFTGFISSDGRGNPGPHGDCGHDRDPITSCPGIGIECSGHGICSGHPEYTCACNAGWQGGDCSERVCPFSTAWFDHPVANEQAHQPKECSNKGLCNRITGECECQPLFEGEACERMTCPGKTSPAGVCSGHGRCLKMEELAEYSQLNGDAIDASYGMNPNLPATWDYDKVFGCLCDGGWQGYDCALKVCPTGDDVTTTGQADEVQTINCRYIGTVAAAPSFKLKFRQQITAPIQFSASAAEVKAALEQLETIGRLKAVTLTSTPPLDQACTVGSGTLIHIVFDTENGDIPPITIEGDFTEGADLEFGSISSTEVVKGTTENVECSGRGICDHSSGQCRCFEGFGSSDGSGGAGGVDDCGYREPYNAPPKANKYNNLWSTPRP